MGLDQYIYRVKKVHMPEGIFTAEELINRGLSYTFVEDAIQEMHRYKDLMPYAAKRMVTDKFVNHKKIEEDYNLTNLRWTGMYDNIFSYRGKDTNGNDVKIEVSFDDIDKKYIIEKAFEAYIWYKYDELFYWRKNYDLQNWIDGDNLQYTLLSAKDIEYINKHFGSDITVMEPTEEEALFYWEWY